MLCRCVHLSRFATALLFAASVPGWAAWADFGDGLEAYDGGDYATAAQAWRQLAESCDPEAASALAELYHQGLGVPPSEKLAAHWYRVAAEAGEPVAQMTLGDFYAEGRGVLRDPIQAYLWLGLAAKQGKAWAKERIAALARELMPEQRNEAEALIAAFRPSTRRHCE